MFDGPSEEFLDRNAIPAHEQLALRLERLAKGGQPPQLRLADTPALHFNCGEPLARPDHEIDLTISIAPVEQLAHSRRRRIRQMSPHCRLHQPPPELVVGRVRLSM